MVICVAPLLSGVLYNLVPTFYPYLVEDPEVVALGIPYLQFRILAIVFVATNFAFRGYWNAVDRSRLYMITLFIMHTCNILLNYVLIFGKLGFPELGVTGAGIGSAIFKPLLARASIYSWGLNSRERRDFSKRRQPEETSRK